MVKGFYLCLVQRLVPLNLPMADLKLVKKNGIPHVWDKLRRKYLKLTPEEWVRQHFVHYLVSQKKYPETSIGLEGGLRINTNLFRTDILIYKNALPWMIVECKAPDIKLTQTVLDQASLYNKKYNTNFISITNGLQHFIFELNTEEKKYIPLKDFPAYVS